MSILSVYISATKNSAFIGTINMFISNVFIVIFEYVYTTGCILFTQIYLQKDQLIIVYLSKF